MKVTTLKAAALAALLTTTVFAAEQQEQKPVRARKAFDASAFLAPKPVVGDGAPALGDAPKPARKAFDPTAFLAPKVDEATVRAQEAAKFAGHVSADDHAQAIRNEEARVRGLFAGHVSAADRDAAVQAETARVQALFAGHVSAADRDAAVQAETARVQALFAGYVKPDVHAAEVAAKNAAEGDLEAYTTAMDAFAPFLKTVMPGMAAAVADDQLTALVAALSKEVPATHLDALKDIDTRAATIRTLIANPQDGLAGDNSEVAALVQRLQLLDALSEFGAKIMA